MRFGYTEKQERIGVALGLPINDKLYLSISDAVGGGTVMGAIFDRLTSLPSATPHTTNSGGTEWRIDCPYNGCVRTKNYGIFSFNESAGFCQDCRCGSNLMEVALNLEGYSQATYSRFGSPASSSGKATQKTTRSKASKKSIDLPYFMNSNLHFSYLSPIECDFVIDYIVSKGIKRGFAMNHVIPYLNENDVVYDYSYVNMNGQKALSMVVPFVSEGSGRVVAIKRRLLPAATVGLNVTSPKWNFNLFPSNPDRFYSSVEWMNAKTVFIVENPIDAYILNCVVSKSRKVKAAFGEAALGMAFVAPISLTASSVVGAAGDCSGRRIVIAYDRDIAGVKYEKRDYGLLRRAGVDAYILGFQGNDKDSLLDSLTKGLINIDDFISIATW